MRRDGHALPAHDAADLDGHAPLRLETLALIRPFDNAAQLKRESAAWKVDRNAARAKVNGQFNTADTGVRLMKLFPSIQT